MLVTDRDPILAAQATPLERIEDIAKGIAEGYKKATEEGYKRIRTVSPLVDLVHSDLTYSLANCEWYNAFYKELQNICNIAGIFIIPDLHIDLLKVKGDSTFNRNPLVIHPPNYDEYYFDLCEKNADRYEKAKDTYILSRMMLMDMKPEFEDFVKGIPAWLMGTTEVMNGYDIVTRKHIRVMKDGNRYRYYTALISDKWKEIKGVPPEMDYVVHFIISNRANLRFVDEK